jgi:integrase
MARLKLAECPRSANYSDDLDVIDALGLPSLGGGPRPSFSDDFWDLSAAVMPAWARSSGAERIRWSAVENPRWRIAAKEAAMVLMSGDIGERFHVPVGTVMPPWSLAERLRDWALWFIWLAEQGVTNLADVAQHHADAYLSWRLEDVAPDTARGEVAAIRNFADCRPALSVDSYGKDFYPWPGQSAARVAGHKNPGENRTAVVPDEVLAPLLAAAMFFVRDAAEDILELLRQRREGPPPPGEDRWQDSPIRHISHNSGDLRAHLTTACFVVIASLTGMRGSEILELRKGCITRHDLGAGKIRYQCNGVLVKGARRGTPTWWTVTEPVAGAVKILERITITEPEGFLFSSPGHGAERTYCLGFTGRYRAFRRVVNANSQEFSLTPLPADSSVSPSQLRRTLARHLASRPHGVLAGMMQLQHVSVATTEGYMGAKGASASSFIWLVEQEKRAAREERVKEMFNDYLAGRVFSGPASRPLLEAFSAVVDEIGPFPGLIESFDEDLLRRLRIVGRHLESLPLNFCLFSDPAQAKCLQEAGRTDLDHPLPPLCGPLGCPHSIMTERRHAQVWITEKRSLKAAVDDPRLPSHERERLAPRIKRIDQLVKPFEADR